MTGPVTSTGMRQQAQHATEAELCCKISSRIFCAPCLPVCPRNRTHSITQAAPNKQTPPPPPLPQPSHLRCRLPLRRERDGRRLAPLLLGVREPRQQLHGLVLVAPGQLRRLQVVGVCVSMRQGARGIAVRAAAEGLARQRDGPGDRGSIWRRGGDSSEWSLGNC